MVLRDQNSIIVDKNYKFKKLDKFYFWFSSSIGVAGALILLIFFASSVYFLSKISSSLQNRFTYVPKAVNLFAPKDVKITNVTDSSFTVSWKTPGQKVTGAVIYNRLENSVSATGSIAYDDRQASKEFETHHVTIRNLSPSTVYKLQILSGQEKFATDNKGNPLPTPQTGPVLPQRATLFVDRAEGVVRQSDGVTPASDALIYLTILDKDHKGDPGFSATLSTITDSEGKWTIETSLIRNRNSSSYFNYSTSEDSEQIDAESGSSRFTVVVGASQDFPIKDPIVLPNRQSPSNSF